MVGQTVSRSSGGQLTGGRAGFPGPDFSGFVGLDDYNKPEDMFSATKRASANRILVNTIRSRRGDKSKEHPTPFVSIQQILHTDDATGFMLSGKMGGIFITSPFRRRSVKNISMHYRIRGTRSAGSRLNVAR
nr:hypothetical protein [Yersinia hibernica]